MKLSEVKDILYKLEELTFSLPDGSLVPEHFHVTEVGKVNKQFIDCGGTLRTENVINFQLWSADDYNHRLHPEKLIKIIEIAERHLHLEDNEVEVEYQGETIGKYGISFNGSGFDLVSKQTDCLAKDNCGIPVSKPKVKLSELQTAGSCAPGSGCC